MPSNPMPLYFFFHGDLHKRIHVNRSLDQIDCWTFPGQRIIKYAYTDVRKNYKKAFTTKEVSELINRNPVVINRALRAGHARRPSVSEGIHGSRHIPTFYWSEADIMELHDHFSHTHRGRPRKDGRITPQSMPTAKELRAMIRQNLVYYVQNEDGDFIPTWDAKF